jgi:hypothetical protein
MRYTTGPAAKVVPARNDRMEIDCGGEDAAEVNGRTTATMTMLAGR